MRLSLTALAAALTIAAFVPFAGGAALAEDKSAPTPPAAKAGESELDQLLAKLGDAKFAANRLDGATAAKSVQDPKLLTPLTKLLKDENPDVRLAAIAALGNRDAGDQKKKAADALAPRIKWLEKPESQSELLAVVKSLHDLAQEGSIEALLDNIHDESDLDVVQARAMAVANVPSAVAIEKLIDGMSRTHRGGSGIPGSFSKALASATGERSVNDPDVWRKWWKENKATFSFSAAAERRKTEADRRAEKEERRNGGKSEGGGKNKREKGEDSDKGADEKGDDAKNNGKGEDGKK